jgi:hypothetical protein
MHRRRLDRLLQPQPIAVNPNQLAIQWPET